MSEVKILLRGIRSAANEQSKIINEAAKRFDENKVYDISNPQAFNRMFILGKALKKILDVPVINQDGTANKNIRVECEGYLKFGNE